MIATFGNRVRPAMVAGGGGGGSFNFPNDPVTLGTSGWSNVFNETWPYSPELANPGPFNASTNPFLDPTVATPAKYNCDGVHDPSGRLWIVSDQSPPLGGSNCINGFYPQGYAGGIAPFSQRNWFFNNYGVRFKKIYIGIVWKLSSSFTVPIGNSGFKSFWPSIQSDHDARAYFTLNSANMDFGFNTQNDFDPPNGVFHDQELGSNVGSVQNARLINFLGNWMMTEVILQMASAVNVADGQFSCWFTVPGVGLVTTKTHQYTNVYTPAPSVTNPGYTGWQALDWEPTNGGAPCNPCVPFGVGSIAQDQSMYCNYIRLCGSNT